MMDKERKLEEEMEELKQKFLKENDIDLCVCSYADHVNVLCPEHDLEIHQYSHSLMLEVQYIGKPICNNCDCFSFCAVHLSGCECHCHEGDNWARN